MPKHIDDNEPPKIERRSIRNIPLPEKRRKTDFVDSVAPVNRFRSAPGEVIHKQRRSTDIIPPKAHSSHPLRRSTDILPPEIEKVYLNEQAEAANDQIEEEIINKKVYAKKTKSHRRSTRKVIYGLMTILVVGGIALLSVFSGATVTYTPKSSPISFNNDSYTAYKSNDNGGLLFSVIKLSKEKGVEARASGEEQVSLKASGKIVVYNNASANPQALIRNTRFETPDGKVYRVQSDITIPGKKGDEPGSLEITVYADQPGSDYNIDLSDFTLPGLKGDPRFTTIYARSKTPMTGGFVGVTKKVSESDLTGAKTTLETSLRAELLEEAKAQVPEDFVLYPNLTQISYQDLPQTVSTGDTATINVHADFYGVMFKKIDLNNFLVSKKIEDSTSSLFKIQNLESLEASFVSNTPVDILNTSEIQFVITGETTAESTISEESLKKDLAGKPKNDLKDIIRVNYPNILNARGVIRPFWKTSFPDDVEKIKIVKTTLK